jgi:hypothetical protein
LRVYNLDTLETGVLYPEWYEVRMRANLEVFKMVCKNDHTESDMGKGKELRSRIEDGKSE